LPIFLIPLEDPGGRAPELFSRPIESLIGGPSSLLIKIGWGWWGAAINNKPVEIMEILETPLNHQSSIVPLLSYKRRMALSRSVIN
jgi:hypothetical protein